MSLSYEFSIGSVRAKEKDLLNSADVEQLLAYDNLDDFVHYLNDKGYGDGKDVDLVLKDRSKKMWAYLKSVAPDFDIFKPFIIENDAHNFKVILKCIMSGKKRDDLLVSPCTIDTSFLTEAVEHKRFDKLPEWISSSAKEAYEIITHKSDAREADAVIDRAVMEYMLSLIEEYKSDFLNEYFNTLVFYNNIKTALRSSKTQVGADYLKKALCEVKDFNKESVINATLKGSDALLELLSKKSEYGCSESVEEFKASPSLFEKYVDNRLMKLALESCKRASEGCEPLIGYYLGFEAEKKVIHIIESGIRTGADKETIRERLREIYG
ncbi:MAG: V-type ATPase subunit [Ruminococcus sp.]|nr:V-type ATPase subunit [Ruminococcus sp.]